MQFIADTRNICLFLNFIQHFQNKTNKLNDRFETPSSVPRGFTNLKQ